MQIILFSNNDYSDDENDNDIFLINIYDEYSHSEIIDRCDFRQHHMIQARLSSDKSLLQEQVQSNRENNLLTSNSITENDGKSTQKTNKTFPTILKLIQGALIGGVNYDDIYMDTDPAIETIPSITSNNPNKHQNLNTHKIPNLHKTARKVARLEKKKT